MSGVVIGQESAIDNEATNIARKARLESYIDKLAKAEVFELRFFGGEFTVFKYWRELMSYAVSKGFFISFVSNGYVLSEEDAGYLSKCGITECSISIHGTEIVHDTVVQKNGSFRRAVQSVQLLSAEGINVSVVFTPHDKNIGNLPDFVSDLYLNHSVKSFSVNRLFYSDNANNLTLSNYLKLLAVIDDCQKKFGITISLSDSFPRCLVPARYWKYLCYCSQGVGFAQVDYNGNIKHCSAISNVLGNLDNVSLGKMWGEGLNTFRNLDHLPLSCKLCPIFCGGGCSASRGVNEKFSPDQFISRPFEESKLYSYGWIVYNTMRKHFFDLFYRPSVLPTMKADMAKPFVTKRFRLRQEDTNTFLAMFAGVGIRILSPEAALILKLSDGTRSISDLVSECLRHGFAMDALTVQEIVREFP